MSLYNYMSCRVVAAPAGRFCMHHSAKLQCSMTAQAYFSNQRLLPFGFAEPWSGPTWSGPGGRGL